MTTDQETTTDKKSLSDEPEATKVATLDESTGTHDDETAGETAAAVELTETDTADELADGEVGTDAEIAEPTASPVRRSKWTRVGAGVLAALLIASAGLTGWLYFHSYRPDQLTGKGSSDAALNAAKDGTVAVLSYSPDNLDKDLDGAKSYLTGDFLTYYSQFTDQVVRPAVKTKQVSTTAEVVRAAVSEMHPDQAKVLVFVNQTTTSSDRAEPSQAASSVVVTMHKVDGKWLISAFDPV